MEGIILNSIMEIEHLVEEIGPQIPFKDTTDIGDLVLFLKEEGPGEKITIAYARIMGIDRDTSKRDEWWHLHLVFLDLPLVPRTLILQTSHFTGKEIFTMGGRKVFIKSVNFDALEPEFSLNQNGPTQKEPVSKEKKLTPKKPTFTLIK